MITKNINECTIEELKAIGFDHIQVINRLNQELQMIHQRIVQLSSVQTEVVNKKAPKGNKATEI